MWKKKPLSVMEFPDQPKFSCGYTRRKKKSKRKQTKMIWYNLLFRKFIIMMLQLTLIKFVLTCIAIQNCSSYDKDQA